MAEKTLYYKVSLIFPNPNVPKFTCSIQFNNESEAKEYIIECLKFCAFPVEGAIEDNNSKLIEHVRYALMPTKYGF